MASDKWMEFNGNELVNVARTARLAQWMGLNTVRIRQELVSTLEARFLPDGFGLGGFGLSPFGGGSAYDIVYADITGAPWYDEGFEASREFAGVVPLAFQGLDDSTLESTITEYTTNGGRSGTPRNATKTIVASVALVGTTERGVEYGKRWLNRLLRESATPSVCAGGPLSYLRTADADAEVVHLRDVRLTRGLSITKKKVSRCSTTWLATFTLTAGDPFEYGEELPQFYDMGADEETLSVHPTLVAQGLFNDLEEVTCPIYDYTPIYDPAGPALVAPPSVPTYLPDNWSVIDGAHFRRWWVRLNPVEPSATEMVPRFVLYSGVEARWVRVCVWDHESANDAMCGPLFTAIVSYLPPGVPVYIDGENEAAYAWDGFSPSVRRTDSLVFGTDATPIQWTSFNDPDGLLVTMDAFFTDGVPAGAGTLRGQLSFVPKSD